ncbi:D-beta-hydroxybutyrate dehydrogenase, mitochondrial [Aplysia californica]|uniref:D-beta-hydroxybutyrate dehydrogenase, mitochondrial n=1 Tax=Aplysia californica TaxID=6500 RepID=A0ABM1VZR1_APLCA|nr:D-beta-hydroxybutyrate dehydrogenase, mitochondrial [Aplysia californica]
MSDLDLAGFQKLETAGWIVALTFLFFFLGHVFVFLGVCFVVRAIFLTYKNRTLPKIDTSGKTVVVTGCDSGFGLGLAQRLHNRGFTVFATCFSLESNGAKQLSGVNSERLKVVPVDVTNDDSVARCLRVVREQCADKGLWGLVNNAGQNFVGDCELTTMTQYLEIANVNLFGMVRMCKAFLPLLRQAKGRVINVTSVKGLFAIPANAAYTISKFGGEAFSDTLRQEMTQYGVTVCIVEPGNFGGTTGCLNEAGIKTLKRFFDEQWEEASEEVKEFYGRAHLQQELDDAKTSALTGCTTINPVLDAFEDALRNQSPKYRYLVDGSKSYIDVYNWLARLRPYLPSRIFNRLRAYFFSYSVYK